MTPPIVSTQTPYPLGCHLEPTPDPRNHPLSAVLPVIKPPRSRSYASTLTLNQGQTPGCVGWSEATNLASQPIPEAGVNDNIGLKIYQKAQTLDPWAGQPHDGSTILAGMKAVMQLFPGIYDSYKFARNINEVIAALGYIGPVIMGTDWLNSMFTSDPVTHILNVEDTSGVAGGHAYMLWGQSVEKGLFFQHNTWGNGWGLHGKSFIRFKDLEMLLNRPGGQCIVPMGKKHVTIN